MTTVTAKCLVETKHVENTQTTQYTAPTGTRTLIDKITVSNPSASPVTFAANVVVSGGSAGASNLVVSTTIAAGATELCSAVVGHVLQPGDFVSTLAGTATALVFRMSGREITG
jgi:hypothetical protein